MFTRPTPNLRNNSSNSSINNNMCKGQVQAAISSRSSNNRLKTINSNSNSNSVTLLQDLSPCNSSLLLKAIASFSQTSIADKVLVERFRVKVALRSKSALNSNNQLNNNINLVTKILTRRQTAKPICKPSRCTFSCSSNR